MKHYLTVLQINYITYIASNKNTRSIYDYGVIIIAKKKTPKKKAPARKKKNVCEFC